MFTFISLLVLVFSIIIHEVAHGYAANTLGDPTARLAGRLTLNPFPHLDPMGSIILPALLTLTNSPIFFGWAKPVPYNPYNLHNRRWGEMLVAGAGCATNLSIATFFGLLIRYASTSLSPAELQIAAGITLVNLFLALFNLIPFPPLDGFTVLKNALPWHLGLRLAQFEEHVRSLGFASLVLFLIFFSYILSGPFSHLVFFLFSLLTGSGI